MKSARVHREYSGDTSELTPVTRPTPTRTDRFKASLGREAEVRVEYGGPGYLIVLIDAVTADPDRAE